LIVEHLQSRRLVVVVGTCAVSAYFYVWFMEDFAASSATFALTTYGTFYFVVAAVVARPWIVGLPLLIVPVELRTGAACGPSGPCRAVWVVLLIYYMPFAISGVITGLGAGYGLRRLARMRTERNAPA